MAFHHVAITTKDLDATHRFYTEAMGFELVKVEAQPTPTPDETGWARHLFYDTGNGEMLAIWDIHDAMLDAGGYHTEISTGLGLPPWANHIAFASPDVDDLKLKLERWIEKGIDCVRIDHGWCTSIYADDPNGITVEFCASTREFTDDDRAEARAQLAASKPELNRTEPEVEFFTANATA
jgi:catechol 2,3-dioxygenase-like lactoylglutathione lyase family enzyme